MLVVCATLVACATPTPAPAPTSAPVVAAPTQAPTAVPPTKAPAPTAVPPTAAPAAQVKPPIPYPDPNDLGLGGGTVKRLPINQIETYKALPKYQQAPSLDKFVASGQLPPVEKRLPKEPAVMLASGMKDGLGVYGDLWRGFSACPTSGYNFMAGVSLGWFGIEDYSVHGSALVSTGPLFRVDQDVEPIPNTAKSWEWSADGKVLTIHLIEGAKWSDGVPFNADDVMFTWEGYILDQNVTAPHHQDDWSWGGKPATLEKVDDYTVKFTFPVAKPLDAFYMMNFGNFDVEPAHILKPLHPKWSTATPKPTYKDFMNALGPNKLPLVTMGPWVVTEYKTDELMIMRRNPYYWKVDEAGNQLPYLDEVQYRKGTSGVGRDLCTIAGDCDHMNLENPSTFVEAMTKAQDPAAKFNVTWGPELLGYDIQFNYSVDVGITDKVRDPAVRALFRDLRFRQALSYATDRDGIAQSIMKGPFLRGWAGGLYPGAPDFDKSAVVYYPYDPPSAKALLAQIGLKDTNNDGVLEWTTGPTAGQPVVVQLMANQDQKETQSVAEALVNQWGAVGIKVNMKIWDSQTQNDALHSGNWDMRSYRDDQPFALPFTNPSELAPLTKDFRNHLEGNTPRQMMDFEPSLVDIVTKYRATFDTAERKKLMTQYNNIFTKNVYDLGIFIGRYGLGTAKRVKNIPDGTPAFMYTWVESAIMLDTLWSPKDQQLPENRPNTIPVYK
jgi:peptide/nickel transport system substrate-binding protein